jgi:type VI secretion system protein ImpA
VAAWLTEALVRREGFAGLGQGLSLIHRLLDTYWDSVYPEIDEDGDMDLRATPLRWAGSQLDSAIRSVPLTKAGHNWYQYKESRAIPSEDAARADPSRQMAREEAIKDGQTPPEEFDKGFESTPLEFFKRTYDTLAALIENVETLGAWCDEKFGDEAPDFSPLKNSLGEVHATARVLWKEKGGTEAPAAEAEEAPAEEWPGEQAAPAVFGEPPSVSSAPAAAPRRATGGMEPSSQEDAMARLLAAARYLRRENPLQAGAYLIPRMLRWGELRAAGGYPDPALLAAPGAELRISLKRLAAEGFWDKVGELAEDAAGQPCGRAWLDLQRYACFACQFAGANAVIEAILAGLKSLLADVPQLLQWTLADDTPVANAETMAWLKDRGVLPGAAPPPAEVAVAPPPPPPVWYPPPAPPGSGDGSSDAAAPDAYALAIATAQAGNIEEGLEILSREMAQEPCGRDRFLRKVQLAQLCLATGNEAIAEPVLNDLAEEIDRRNLKEWELADVVAQPLTMLYRCLESTPEGAKEKRELYARICRLYPARAVRLPR